MTAEREFPIDHEPLISELAAMVEAAASIAPESHDEDGGRFMNHGHAARHWHRRLLQAEAKRQELWQRLNDANCMAINIAAALNLLSAEGSIGRGDVPDYVTGTIWLCQGAMNKLAEHLQDSV